MHKKYLCSPNLNQALLFGVNLYHFYTIDTFALTPPVVFTISTTLLIVTLWYNYHLYLGYFNVEHFGIIIFII